MIDLSEFSKSYKIIHDRDFRLRMRHTGVIKLLENTPKRRRHITIAKQPISRTKVILMEGAESAIVTMNEGGHVGLVVRNDAKVHLKVDTPDTDPKPPKIDVKIIASNNANVVIETKGVARIRAFLYDKAFMCLLCGDGSDVKIRNTDDTYVVCNDFKPMTHPES